ncbi:hypothetical protein ABZ388_21740 [Micromonospora parva]
MNAIGQPARPEHARALGIPLTTFAEWTRQYLRDERAGGHRDVRSLWS